MVQVLEIEANQCIRSNQLKGKVSDSFGSIADFENNR